MNVQKRVVFRVLLVLGLLFLFTSCKPLVGKATGFPEEGLVSYWDFDDVTDDGIADDVVGGNDGTINGGAAYVTGKFGKALQFDGTGDYVEVADDSSLHFGTGDFTLALWVKRGDAAYGGPLISKVKKESSGPIKVLAFYISSSSLLPGNAVITTSSAGTPAKSNDVSSEESVDTIWTHLVVVRRGKRLELYENGKLDAFSSRDLVDFDNDQPLLLGKDVTPSFFTGLLDEVRIYSRALSADEIKLLYLPPEPSNYIARWNFEGDGEVIEEEKNNYDGKVIPKTSGTWSRTAVRAGTADEGKALHFTGREGELAAVNVSIDTNGDGKNDASIIPEGLQITDALTVSAWVKPARRPLEGRMIASTGAWSLGADSGSDMLSFGVEGTAEVTDTNFFSEHQDAWVHVVGVFEGDSTTGVTSGKQLRLFVNGEETGTATGTIPALLAYGRTTSLLSIGADNKGMKNWDGDIDDLRMYDSALTAQEVTALYYHGKSGDCFNKLCPTTLAVEQLPVVAEETSLVGKTKSTLTALISTSRKDLLVDHTATFQTVAATTPRAQILDFAYNGPNYYASLTALDAWEATAQVKAISVANGQEKGVLDLAATAEESLSFAPEQAPLNLVGNEAPEAYMQSLGYFDSEGTLGLVVGATPVMNFDYSASWTVTLLSGLPQEFWFNGEKHDLNYVRLPDGSSVVIVDGKEYALSEVFSAVHYFDSLRTLGVNITLNATSGALAMITFVRQPTGLNNTYEEVLTRERSLTFGTEVLRVCANDPPILAALTLCKSETEVLDLADGVPKINASYPGTLFLYERPSTGEKQGKALHLFNLDTTDTYEFALYFANNLVQGKRLALQLDGEYYLLEMEDKTARFLELTNLKLSKISGKTRLVYRPIGDQEIVKFNLPLLKQINLKLLTQPQLKYVIKKTTTAVAEAVNITRQLQTTVSTYGAVNITDAKGQSQAGVVALDASDISTLQGKMKIKYGTTPTLLELSFNQPREISNVVYGKTDDANKEAGLSLNYNRFTPGGTTENPQFTKYADIYLLYDLGAPSSAAKTHRFTDTEFILPLLKGNKLALKAGSEYFLLGYAEPWTGSVSGGFKTELLRLKNFAGKEFLPQVSEDGLTLTFDLENGNAVKAAINTSASTITFSYVSTTDALSSVVKELTLMDELQAKVTTFNPLELEDTKQAGSTTPTTISIHPEDSKYVREEMRVKFAYDSSDDELRLFEDLPQSWGTVAGKTVGPKIHSEGKVLLLYTTFESSRGIFTKSAEVYLSYNLSEGEKTRPFTPEDFVLPLVEQGKKIVLEYKNNHYLLSYSGTLAEGLRYNRFRLKPLVGGSSMTPSVAESSISFSVPGGVLVINFDTVNRKVSFTSVLAGAAVKQFTPAREYKTELPPYSLTPGADNVLEIGNTLLWNCDSASTTAFSESVYVCWDADPSTRGGSQFARGEWIDNENEKVTSLGTLPTDLFLMYRGRKASGEKEVTAQHVLATIDDDDTTAIGVSSSAVDWDMLTNNLLQLKEPVLKVNELYYELVGGRTLNTFSLRNMSGVMLEQRRVTSTAEGAEKMVLVVNETTILKFEQQLDSTTKKIQLLVSVEPYVVASVKGVVQEVASGDTITFVPSLGELEYNLGVEFGSLTRVATLTIQEDGEDIFMGRVPEGQSKSILLSNGEVVTVDVPVQTGANVVLKIRR